MSDGDDVTRRGVLRASTATVAAVGGIGTAAGLSPTAGGTDAEKLRRSAEQVPCLALTDRTSRIRAGVPEFATGIRPGSQMFIEYPDRSTAGCTANFVWTDGADLYIGAAGHCFLPQGINASANARRPGETDGDVYDVGQLSIAVCDDCAVGGQTGLTVQGRTIALGDVVYARQSLPGGSEVGHDFGLVRIPDDARDAVDPSMPQFGGPTGVSDAAVASGTPVNQYGAGVANGEVFATQGSNGVSQGDLGSPNSWYAAIRASPGDSGSPLQTTTVGAGPEGGVAAGILTHLTGGGTAGTTIGRCKEMTRVDVGLDIAVVPASG
jgi:hypothetical protein